MKTKFAITTVSLIRTSEEKEVVLETLNNLSRLNVPIVVVDGGSSPSDKSAIRKFPNIHFYETNEGLTKQLIISHQKAEQLADYLLYLQTDKLDFAITTAEKMIKTYETLERKGIFIPARTKECRETYPSYQQTQEAFLNFFMSDFIGIKSDYFAGPKIYPSFLVKYLDQLKGDIGWGIEAFFYVIAKRLGLPFDFIDSYIQSPKDIGDPEKIKEYRLKITQWQIDAFLQAQKVKL